eukprot:Sro1296_g260410.2  (416) ;mRNA; r:22774-24585
MWRWALRGGCEGLKNPYVMIMNAALFATQRIYDNIGVMVVNENQAILQENRVALQNQLFTTNTYVLTGNTDKNLQKEFPKFDQVEERNVDDNCNTCSSLSTRFLEEEKEGALSSATTAHLRKYAGCDGYDSDNVGIIDNCGEDATPPEIKVSESRGFRGHGGQYKVHGQLFQSSSSALSFLRKSLTVDDDCAKSDDLDLPLEVVETGNCGISVDAYPIHVNHSCDGKNQTGAVNHFQMDVDSDAPEIACGFAAFSSSLAMSADGKTMLVEEDDGKLFSSGFFYSVSVRTLSFLNSYSSNEFSIRMRLFVFVCAFASFRSLARTRRRGRLNRDECKGSKANGNLGKNSRRCGSEGVDLVFKRSSSAKGIRTYDITVSATDAAGWTSKDTCRILVVPKAEQEGRERRCGRCFSETNK